MSTTLHQLGAYVAVSALVFVRLLSCSQTSKNNRKSVRLIDMSKNHQKMTFYSIIHLKSESPEGPWVRILLPPLEFFFKIIYFLMSFLTNMIYFNNFDTFCSYLSTFFSTKMIKIHIKCKQIIISK